MSNTNLDVNAAYRISREVYDETNFSKQFPAFPTKPAPLNSRIRARFRGIRFLDMLSACFPFVSILASFYSLRAFISDIIAGLTMSILHIPQGMAYGFLAGLQPVNGLYTSFFPALVYFFFGTSRHISIGTFSIVALLTSDPVNRLSAEFTPLNESSVDPEDQIADYRLQVAIVVTLIVGLLQLAMGVCQLGVLIVYISAPLLSGFTCASAIHVFLSQLQGLFGVKLPSVTGAGRSFRILINFFSCIRQVNVPTFLIAVVCIGILLLFKFLINPKVTSRLRVSIPIELLLLITATAISHFAQFHERFNVAIVGEIPKGFPSPMVPQPSLIIDVLLDSVVVGFVSLATTTSLVKLYASKHAYSVRYSQELSALGLCNVVSSFFRCHACSAALARTSVSNDSGMQSQVASIISCSVLLLVLTVIGPLLQSVPMAVLSSLIVVSLSGILMQVTDFTALWRVSRYDALIWLVAFLATTFIDVPIGLLVGLGFSVATVLQRAQRSNCYELGRLDDTDLYVELKRYPDAKKLDRICIIRFNGSLYFANAEELRDYVIRLCGVDANQILFETTKIHPHSNVLKNCCQHWVKSHSSRSRPETSNSVVEENVIVELETTPISLIKATAKLSFIILDASSWTFIDSVGLKILKDVFISYKSIDISVLFAACQDEIQRSLSKAKPASTQMEHTFFPTVHDAVLFAESELNFRHQTDSAANRMRKILHRKSDATELVLARVLPANAMDHSNDASAILSHLSNSEQSGRASHTEEEHLNG